MAKQPDTATGTLVRYIPAGAKRDELLGLVRVGFKFQSQQRRGKRPGFLHHYIVGLVERMGTQVKFERLLEELTLEASRRNQEANGKALPPVETVSRGFELLTYHHPKHGERQVTFGTLRNYLTAAKKYKFPASPKR